MRAAQQQLTQGSIWWHSGLYNPSNIAAKGLAWDSIHYYLIYIRDMLILKYYDFPRLLFQAHNLNVLPWSDQKPNITGLGV